MTAEEEKKRLLIKISRLYYLDKLNQKQIARKLGISMPSVSRYLAKAEEENIVEIKINEGNLTYSAADEIEIENRFNLHECIIIESREEIEKTRLELGKSVGRLLDRICGQDDYIGVSWGETLQAVGKSMEVTKKRSVHVVPIIGGMGYTATAFYTNAIVQNIAGKMNGTSYLLNFPAVLDNPEMKSMIEKDRNTQHIFELWKKLDIVLMSVSKLSKTASVYRHGIFTEAELGKLNRLNIAGAVNFNLFDKEGQGISNELDKRIVKLGLEEIKSVHHRVIIAIGRDKVEPVIAALRGGIGNVLVTDSATAELILQENT